MCVCSDFDDIYYNAAFGNCFTFNLGVNESHTQTESSYRAGPTYGQSLRYHTQTESSYRVGPT